MDRVTLLCEIIIPLIGVFLIALARYTGLIHEDTAIRLLRPTSDISIPEE